MITEEEARNCYDDLKKHGVWDENEKEFVKKFRKWSLKNKPGKNADKKMVKELYKKISSCKAGILENFLHYAFVAKTEKKKEYDIDYIYSSEKKQTGGGPREFMKKMENRKPKKSPLRHEIKPDIGSNNKIITRRIKNNNKEENIEWEF